MPIEFRCEKCNRKLRVPDAASGKKARCQCGNIILVPVANEDTQTIVSHPDSTTNRQQNLPVAEALDTKQIPSAELKSDADATLLSPSSEIKSAPHAPFDDKASNDATMVAPSNDSTIMKPIGDNDQTLLAPTPSQSRVTEGFTRAPEKQFSDTAGGAKYFGQYQIVSELGRGGMGVVYKARDPKLNREVAIKVLIAGEDASQEAIKRFHKEAEATAKLQHPNVVSIFDIGVQGNQHYFAMEFIKGKPLNEIIKSGEMKTSDKLAMMAKVAKAMDYCHQQGILHRDLKPANIFVTPNGEPKIMDFGLAKSTEGEDAHLTRTGTIMGTPSYMSPEQAESSKDIDARTDVWALGIILYEMLCGEVPFRGNSSMEVLTKVAVDDPVPLIKRVKIQSDLNTVVMKCLEKDRNTRYQAARELASDLDAYMNGEPISAKPPSTGQKLIRKIRKNKMVAGISAAFVAILLIGLTTGLHYFGKAQIKPQIMSQLDKLQPDEKNARSAIESLKPWMEDSNGLEILVEELASQSDSHRWGAILAMQESAPGKYCEQTVLAFTGTSHPDVERVALEYLKRDLNSERMKKIIEKSGGIKNPAVADFIFVEFGKASGIEGVKNIVVGKDWPQTTLDAHKKALGGQAYFALLSMINNSKTDAELETSIKNAHYQPDWQTWYPNVAPALFKILKEKHSPAVRNETVLALTGGDARSINALIDFLKSETDTQVIRNAFLTLAETKEGVLSLSKLFDEERRDDIRALYSEIFVSVLMSLREGVKQSFNGKLPVEMSDILTSHLKNDPSEKVRANIAQALSFVFNNNMGSEDLVKALIEDAKNEKAPKVREQIVSTLIKIVENNVHCDLVVPYMLKSLKDEKGYTNLNRIANCFPMLAARGKLSSNDIPQMLATKNNLDESQHFFRNIQGSFSEAIFNMTKNDQQQVVSRLLDGIRSSDKDIRANAIAIGSFLIEKNVVYPEISEALFVSINKNDNVNILEIYPYLLALATKKYLTAEQVVVLGNIVSRPNNSNEVSSQTGFVLTTYLDNTENRELAISTCVLLIKRPPYGADKKMLIDKLGKFVGKKFPDIASFEKWWEENKDKDFVKFPPDITNK